MYEKLTSKCHQKYKCSSNELGRCFSLQSVSFLFGDFNPSHAGPAIWRFWLCHSQHTCNILCIQFSMVGFNILNVLTVHKEIWKLILKFQDKKEMKWKFDARYKVDTILKEDQSTGDVQTRSVKANWIWTVKWLWLSL